MLALPQALAVIYLTLLSTLLGNPYQGWHIMRLFIADANQDLRVGLQLRLHQEPGMPVVGMAVRTKGLLTQVAASQPDVLLLDWFLPGRPAADVLADLHALEQRPQIIVLSIQPETESAALAAGADAFFAKTTSSDGLMAILHKMRSRPADDLARAGGEAYE
jgi:DNA-binding NarL/FixJ family response regulator